LAARCDRLRTDALSLPPVAPLRQRDADSVNKLVAGALLECSRQQAWSIIQRPGHTKEIVAQTAKALGLDDRVAVIAHNDLPVAR